MSEYIQAMPPCKIRTSDKNDGSPVLLWKITRNGPMPMIPGPAGAPVAFTGLCRIERDYYTLTDDVNS